MVVEPPVGRGMTNVQTINCLLVLIVRNSTRYIPATRAGTKPPVVYHIHLLVIAITPKGTGNTREHFLSCRPQVDTEVAGTDHRQGENEQTKSAAHCCFVCVVEIVFPFLWRRIYIFYGSPKNEFGQKGIFTKAKGQKGLMIFIMKVTSQSSCLSGEQE